MLRSPIRPLDRPASPRRGVGGGGRPTDFGELYECYDDHVVHRPELWDCSRAGGNARLTTLVTTVATRLRPEFLALSSCHYEILGTGFWHGMVTGTGIACFFYDEPSGRGLMALLDPFDGSAMTHFGRFTRVMLDRVDGRMPN